MSENSGANPVASPASESGGGFVVSPKLLAQIAALAAFATVGGGGASLIAQPGAEIAALTQKIEDLEKSVDVVAIAMQEVKSDLKHLGKNAVRIEERVDDHERRIRELEKD